MRIVSLLPAATEIVAALGGIDLLVGVSHECDHPPEVRRLPRVTAGVIDVTQPAAAIDEQVRRQTATGQPLFRLDAARLRELAPDVVLTQAVCDVCAVAEGEVREVAARLPSPPGIVSLRADSIDGILSDVERTGRAIGRPDRAVRLAAALRSRLARVHDTLRLARAPRPRVMVVEWLEPVFVAGHWVPEMVHRAGGLHVLVRAGEHSRTSSAQELHDFAPELLLFAPCGFSLARASRDARELLAGDGWSWARELPCWALDGNALTSRPGPRIVTGVEVMAQVLHPTLFPPADASLALKL
jgi:iron complex transport system substrate-binding protein